MSCSVYNRHMNLYVLVKLLPIGENGIRIYRDGCRVGQSTADTSTTSFASWQSFAHYHYGTTYRTLPLHLHAATVVVKFLDASTFLRSIDLFLFHSSAEQTAKNLNRFLGGVPIDESGLLSGKRRKI